jgi:hypothetical protein
MNSNAGWDPNSWGFVEWAIGFGWAAVMAVGGWIYRLSLRVALLDRAVFEMNKDIDQRHMENRAGRADLMREIHGLRDYFQDFHRDLSRRIDDAVMGKRSSND